MFISVVRRTPLRVATYYSLLTTHYLLLTTYGVPRCELLAEWARGRRVGSTAHGMAIPRVDVTHVLQGADVRLVAGAASAIPRIRVD